MSAVILETTISLDGFSAGPDGSAEYPMGRGGERLHDWIFDKKGPGDERVLKEMAARVGAVLVGRHTYDIAIDGPWEGKTPFDVPAVVVTHRPVSKKVAGFDYVTEGPQAAIELAQKRAGGKDIWLMGGAGLQQVFLAAGLVDELYIHIVPVLLCGGLRLFDKLGVRHVELEIVSSVQTPAAHHMRFRVAGRPAAKAG